MDSLAALLWGKSTGVIFLGIALLVLVVLLWLPADIGEVRVGTDKIGVISGAALSQETLSYTLSLPLIMRGYPPPPPVFGVYMGPVNESGGVTQAIQAGVHWVNLSAFNWAAIEPQLTDPPTYHWEVVDEQSFIDAAQNDLTVIARVSATPQWAREIPGHNCSRIRRDSLDEFARFLAELVRRYQALPYNIRYWELDGEVDVAPSLVDPANPIGFWCWGDDEDAYYGGGYFAEMLRWAYPAIKAADPQAQVVIGGLLLDCDPRNPPPGKTCTPARFLEGILRGGGGPYFDVVSFHSYAYYGGTPGDMGNPNWTGGVWMQSTVVREKASFLREVLNTYGYENKGLMNTETALFCFEASDECFQTQAMYVPRAYAEALAYDLMAQVWFLMKDPVWRNTGLLRADMTPKPVYYAYATAATFLSSVEYVGPVAGYPAEVEGYAFHRTNGARIEVIWSEDGGSHAVGLPSGASAYDKYGSLLPGPSILVDNSPVYISWP